MSCQNEFINLNFHTIYTYRKHEYSKSNVFLTSYINTHSINPLTKSPHKLLIVKDIDKVDKKKGDYCK